MLRGSQSHVLGEACKGREKRPAIPSLFPSPSTQVIQRGPQTLGCRNKLSSCTMAEVLTHRITRYESNQLFLFKLLILETDYYIGIESKKMVTFEYR